ncbi:MAG: nuclear transport factor 2 family protein [Acetobacteraceae bacterium]|nr:nuclear transport factor 2 family protein [Acetobacteraceae bacterium]
MSRPALALLGLLAAGPAAAQATPAELLRAWAEAYATQDGPRAAALYTEEARLWGSVSRAQTVGRAAIADYFGRVRPGAVQISVSFGDHALRLLTPEVAVASGHYTFGRRAADGTPSEEPSRFSMTLLRGPDGAWRIADHHSSRLPAR